MIDKLFGQYVLLCCKQSYQTGVDQYFVRQIDQNIFKDILNLSNFALFIFGTEFNQLLTQYVEMLLNLLNLFVADTNQHKFDPKNIDKNNKYKLTFC